MLSAIIDRESAKEAAYVLGMTRNTLRTHLERVHERTGCGTTIAAVYALRHELEDYRRNRP